MEPNSSEVRHKKIKGPVVDSTINIKNAITCSDVPENLFDVTAAKKHFSKFGKVLRIRLFPKRQMCIIEYDSPLAAEKAVLNAGAFDGFMFEVSRTKPRVRKRSKKEEDPDWVPDSDVEDELSAMGSTPIYRTTRQKPMDQDTVKPSIPVIKTRSPAMKSSTFRKPDINQNDRSLFSSQVISGTSSPVLVVGSQTSLSTSDAVTELVQLRNRTSMTSDEQWRTLDARDRILRGWGGTGSRVKMGGATIGTCQDMCPEKERLHRQAEHQVMTLETAVGSDSELESWRAVKQYTRSSADQEMPMCYELRPASVLMRTCSYLLHEIADTERPVSLADWFHFMWDRLRGIRKDITQQALCCAESISLVEMCARFHAHCAARLADLEHTQFDQKLNTDNLTKCLQTLKHMYTDAAPKQKPREAEFRGYIALLNLGDSNFWWEVKQLPQEIQKSKDISFAIKVFNALDNNNYVRFFRLVREEASYLQACILLRYFNDVRARALARVIKAFAPRGGARYPAFEFMNILAFESIDSMKAFINHYGLRFGRATEDELSVILDRNQFIEDSDPYPVARSIKLIESKRRQSIGEVIAGGHMPDKNYFNYTLYTSFTSDGYLKDEALLAEGQLYNTLNDTNKDIRSLKAEIMKQIKGGRKFGSDQSSFPKENYIKPQTPHFLPKSPPRSVVKNKNEDFSTTFSFKPAIPVIAEEMIKTLPENLFQVDTKSIFSFSKPEESHSAGLWSTAVKDTFKSQGSNTPFSTGTNKESLFRNAQTLFSSSNKDPKGESLKSLFSQSNSVKENRSSFVTNNTNNLFAKKDSNDGSSIFGNKDQFKGLNSQGNADPKSVFGSVSSTSKVAPETNLFRIPNGETQQQVISPGSLFKSVNQDLDVNTGANTFLQNKTKPFGSVAAQIFESANNFKKENELEKQKAEELKLEIQRQAEIKRKEDQKREELQRQQEEAKKLQEEKQRKEEERIQEELKRQEEIKMQALRKAEEDRLFKEMVENKSSQLTDELINEVNNDLVFQLLKEEIELLTELIHYANLVSSEIVSDICTEICSAEIIAIKYRTNKLMKKWFNVWRRHYLRNIKRRNCLDDTPVWLCDLSPYQKGVKLRKSVESAVLSNMNAVHRGFRFSGEPKPPIVPAPIKILDTIRSPLLKRMKQINYPYDKCFFWKTTIVSPGAMKWMYKRIEIENWLLKAFKDKEKHTESETLIQVGKDSWNKLMNFAISVSLINIETKHQINEGIAGTNGLFVCVTEKDVDIIIDLLNEICSQKYKYHRFPVAIIVPRVLSVENQLQQFLNQLLNNRDISHFKFFTVDPDNLEDSMTLATNSALRWLSKNYPPIPHLEIDNFKSFCQRYLGSELWYRLKIDNSTRIKDLCNNMEKLVQFYNTAIDKLIEIVTDEELCNYSSFPLELQKYLNRDSPYPKPYEFITGTVKTIDNMESIKKMLQALKLKVPQNCYSNDLTNMKEYITKYCKQIEWFKNPDEVVCKAVSLLPDEYRDQSFSLKQFGEIVTLLNFVVYEKIISLDNLRNFYVIYEKSKLEEYSKYLWMYDVDIINSLKHKVTEYCDYELDYLIEAKRKKIAFQNEDMLMLEEKDETLVEESIIEKDKEITRYLSCKQTVKDLEQQLKKESEKSQALERLLQAALSEN